MNSLDVSFMYQKKLGRLEQDVAEIVKASAQKTQAKTSPVVL